MNAMYKQDLALQFFKGISPHSAVNQLSLWINRCKPLVKALEDAGYRKSIRLLRGCYVQLIYDYLGEP